MIIRSKIVGGYLEVLENGKFIPLSKRPKIPLKRIDETNIMRTKHFSNEQTVEVEKIKAIELLPLLEKTNAYGLTRFKELVTFSVS